MPIVAPVAQVAEEARRWGQIARQSPQAFKQARVSMQRAAGTEHKRGITAIYNLTQSRVGQDLTVRPTEVGMIVSGSKRTISLLSYGWRPTRKGLAGRVIRGGKRSVIPRSFIANGLGGGTVPFIREGDKREMKKGRYAGKTRQPLKALHGPSMADALARTDIAQDMRARIWGRSRTELSRRLKQLTRKR